MRENLSAIRDATLSSVVHAQNLCPLGSGLNMRRWLSWGRHNGDCWFFSFRNLGVQRAVPVAWTVEWFGGAQHDLNMYILYYIPQTTYPASHHCASSSSPPGGNSHGFYHSCGNIGTGLDIFPTPTKLNPYICA